MSVSKVATAIALVAMATPAFAQTTQTAGRVASASDGVFVARSGKMIPATAGMTLVKGDRVVTRANAKARVALEGCTVDMASTSMMNVSNACSAPATLAANSTGLNGANGAVDRFGKTIIIASSVGAAGFGLEKLVNNSGPTTPASVAR